MQKFFFACRKIKYSSGSKVISVYSWNLSTLHALFSPSQYLKALMAYLVSIRLNKYSKTILSACISGVGVHTVEEL